VACSVRARRVLLHVHVLLFRGRAAAQALRHPAVRAAVPAGPRERVGPDCGEDRAYVAARVVLAAINAATTGAAPADHRDAVFADPGDLDRCAGVCGERMRGRERWSSGDACRELVGAPTAHAQARAERDSAAASDGSADWAASRSRKARTCRSGRTIAVPSGGAWSSIRSVSTRLTVALVTVRPPIPAHRVQAIWHGDSAPDPGGQRWRMLRLPAALLPPGGA
jgi:hypothetical protein